MRMKHTENELRSSPSAQSLVLMPLPFVMLGILFLRTLALEGSGSGIEFYLTPHFTALGDAHLWVNALSQIFFSLSLAVGAMVRGPLLTTSKLNIQHEHQKRVYF